MSSKFCAWCSRSATRKGSGRSCFQRNMSGSRLSSKMRVRLRGSQLHRPGEARDRSREVQGKRGRGGQKENLLAAVGGKHIYACWNC